MDQSLQKLNKNQLFQAICLPIKFSLSR